MWCARIGLLSRRSGGKNPQRNHRVRRKQESAITLSHEVKPVATMTGREAEPVELLASDSAVSDARLVEESRRGDRNAFGELVLRYERRLLWVIQRFIRNTEEAEDLTQETFLRVYERLAQFDASRRFGPWLFRIGVNLTLDHLRRKKRHGHWSLFSESPIERAPDPGTADPRNVLDTQQEVRSVLEEIPENYRTVLVLRDLENFSTSEIAGILDRKEATIRWRLAEARSRFQRLWARRQDRTSHPRRTEAEQS